MELNFKGLIMINNKTSKIVFYALFICASFIAQAKDVVQDKSIAERPVIK